MLTRYVDFETGKRTLFEHSQELPIPKIGEHVALPRKREDIPDPEPGISFATHDYYAVKGVNHYPAESRIDVFLKGPV